MNNIQSQWLHKVNNMTVGDIELKEIPKEAITYQLLADAIMMASEHNPYATDDDDSLYRAIGLAKDALKNKIISKQEMVDLCEHALGHSGSLRYIPEEFMTHKLCVEAVKHKGTNYLYVPNHELNNVEIIKSIDFHHIDTLDERKVWARMPHDLQTAMIAVENGISSPVLTIGNKTHEEHVFWSKVIKMRDDIYYAIVDPTPQQTALYQALLK